VGTELLLGQITDTNATFICRELAAIGVDVYFRTTLGDNLGRIVEAIRLAAARSDVVLLTGGLGPTPDDVTREAIAEATGRPLREDPASRRAIEEYFRKLEREPTAANFKQALIPEGGRAIPNGAGTAPGVFLEHEGTVIIALPGVPREMEQMMRRFVLPELRARRPEGLIIKSRVLRVIGLGESNVVKMAEEILARQTNPTIAPLAGRGEVLLRITAKCSSEQEADERIAETEAQLRQVLGEHIYGVDQATLEEDVVGRLIRAGKTIAVAESCTGGLIGNRITNVSGSSRCFPGGVVAYANEAKMALLGVDQDLLAKHGAVSAEVAAAMATGVRELFRADLGVSATGIAGPTGGTAEKPVGLVFIGLATAESVVTERHHFLRDRLDNKFRTSQAALALVRSYLLGLSG